MSIAEQILYPVRSTHLAFEDARQPGKDDLAFAI